MVWSKRVHIKKQTYYTTVTHSETKYTLTASANSCSCFNHKVNTWDTKSEWTKLDNLHEQASYKGRLECSPWWSARPLNVCNLKPTKFLFSPREIGENTYWCEKNRRFYRVCAFAYVVLQPDAVSLLHLSPSQLCSSVLKPDLKNTYKIL